jgi:hypothetical protein
MRGACQKLRDLCPSPGLVKGEVFVARTRRQLRLPWRVEILAAIAVLLGGVAVTACGGSGDRAAPAAFSSALGARFASQAERVATLLDDHDSCAALHLARSLRASVDEEIASGRVALRLRAPLRAGVDALTAGIRCVQRVPAPTPAARRAPQSPPGTGAEPLAPEEPVEEPDADAEGEENQDAGEAADEVEDAEDAAQDVEGVEEDNSGPGNAEDPGDEDSSGSG